MPRKSYNTLIIIINITYNNNSINIIYTIPLISDFNLLISITYTSILTCTSIVIVYTKIDATLRVSKTTTITTSKRGTKRPRDTIGNNIASSSTSKAPRKIPTSKAPYKVPTSKGATITTRKKYR